MDAARATYDAFAAAYDDFNHAYMSERWTGTILGTAVDLGLSGKLILDVGCGTGRSFEPMIDRGWTVTGCDISPGMLAIAEERSGDRATLLLADMRELPILGGFDLVWSINDSMNYLMNGGELESTLVGMRSNLGPRGMIAFDLNTLVTYRTFFSNELVVEHAGRKFVWRGEMDPDRVEPGCFAESSFEAQGEELDPHRHRQRHFPEEEVRSAADGAGLRCLALRGELDGDLHIGLDEERHTKAVYIFAAA